MARDARRAVALPAVAVLALLMAQSAPGTLGGGNGHRGGHVPPYPRYSAALEWPLDEFQAYRIWAHTQGARVTIAEIDTGIDAGQPALSGTVTIVKDLAPGPQGDLSKDSHGTEVAGLIAASGSRSNPQRMAGLAPEASLIDVRVAADAAKVTPAEIAAGIDAAVHADASIINISLGTLTKDRQLTSAVRKAEKKGLLIVASAGATIPVPYPARYPGVLRVAAATQADMPQSPPLSPGGLALYAPGAGLSSTAEVSGPHHVHGYQHGIAGPDYATAYVSAAAALILSADPGLRPAKAGQILVSSAAPMTGGASPGLVKPLAAVQRVLGSGKHRQNSSHGSGGSGSGGQAGGAGKKIVAGTGFRLPVFGWADVLLALVLMIAVMSATFWRRRQGNHEPTIWDGP